MWTLIAIPPAIPQLVLTQHDRIMMKPKSYSSVMIYILISEVIRYIWICISFYKIQYTPCPILLHRSPSSPERGLDLVTLGTGSTTSRRQMRPLLDARQPVSPCHVWGSEAASQGDVWVRSHLAPVQPLLPVSVWKDGSLRFCIDMRHIYTRPRADAYHVPRIKETSVQWRVSRGSGSLTSRVDNKSLS